MSRYIDAIKLKSDMMEAICQGYTEEDMLGIVNEQDTADVVEVKHGHWIASDPRMTGVFWACCSRCGFPLEVHETFKPYKHCPHCGAKMDEVKEWIVNGKECSCANCENRKVLEEYMETEDGRFQGKRTCKGFACIGLIPFKDGHIVWMHDKHGMCEMWKEVTE